MAIKSPFPLVKLPRDKFFKLDDLIWLLPPAVHFFLLVLRPTAIDFLKDAGLKLDGMPQYNIFWGFIVQITMVGTWAGDGFNPAGLLCSTQMGYKRLPKLILLVSSVYLCAYGIKNAESKGFVRRGFVKKTVVGALGSPPLCGVNMKVVEGKTCEMKLCGVLEALQGTCEAGRNKGCCMKPEVYVMDEARHFFALSFIMRIFSPYMGFTIPLWAGIVQAALRLMPSCISGLVSNPQGILFRAILTGNYEVVPYVVAGTVAGSVGAFIAATTVQMLLARLTPVVGSKPEAKTEKKTQ